MKEGRMRWLAHAAFFIVLASSAHIGGFGQIADGGQTDCLESFTHETTPGLEETFAAVRDAPRGGSCI
ncbi:hypothetical protein OKW33_000340 [Paraburkholderia atlantica]|uniref:hypothetical protein n=1 Tax=Paraburkholderia atlantica TaxID=2654982 RepID=UPI0004773A3F|nr:hypothetical protein [Paraburkholderia atlantica]MBB5420732.1 hypothetical protein [Paraburkholderia atlantica]